MGKVFKFQLNQGVVITASGEAGVVHRSRGIHATAEPALLHSLQGRRWKEPLRLGGLKAPSVDSKLTTDSVSL